MMPIACSLHDTGKDTGRRATTEEHFKTLLMSCSFTSIVQKNGHKDKAKIKAGEHTSPVTGWMDVVCKVLESGLLGTLPKGLVAQRQT